MQNARAATHCCFQRYSVPVTEPVSERVEIVDPVTLRYLNGCAEQRGGTIAENARRQLRELALAEGARTSEQALRAISPTYVEDMVAEIEAAAAEAAHG